MYVYMHHHHLQLYITHVLYLFLSRPPFDLHSYPLYSASGLTTTDSTVPDTITTWVGEAFALSRQTGLGISPQAQLTVIKPFFVSLELPFSVNFGEAVTVTPLVFYFGTGRRGPNGIMVGSDGCSVCIYMYS